MSDKDQRKAPVLRFKGFTDDWEQRKLGDIATFINGRAYSKNELLHQGKYKVLRVGNFYTNDSWYYSDMELDKKYYANYGDLLYTWSATFGPHIWKGEKVIYHYHIWKIILSDEITKNFTLQLLEHDKNRLLAEKNGSTMIHLTKKDMENKEIVIPSSTNEQDKVGLLLTKLDYLITLQQRKLDELIQIKEGIGQGLLNRHYRNLSIRFNQENSPWKQTKLGKIASFVNGRAFKQKELMNRGLYPVLRVGNFYTNNKWYYSNLNLSPDKYANKGDLLYTWSASFGPHVWKGPKVIYHYHIWKINFDPAVISKAYLYEFLKLDKKEILANSNGSTMIHITKKDMENKMITVPDMNEQIKIGKILEKLDLKIELNKNKLNNLKSVKQFLLQKMFM